MKRRSGPGLLLAAVIMLAAPAAAQAGSYPSNVGIEAGLALKGPVTAGFGVEFRQRIGGPVAVTGSLRRWFLEGGCDLIVGVPCYEAAWVPAVGLTVGLGRFAKAFYPYVAGRAGPLRFNTDSTSWNVNVGAGIIWMAAARLGLQASVQYDALADRARPQGYSPPTADRLAMTIGLAVTR